MQVSNHDTITTVNVLRESASTFVPGHDLYGPVHKGLRWALASLLMRLGCTAWDDVQAVQMALDDLEGVLYMFAGHAAHEDRHVHVALEARRAGSTASLGRAHERQEHAIAELRALAAQFASAPTSSQPGLWRTLYLRFTAFAGDNLMHMSEEELVAQPLLEALYSLEQLAAIHQQLLAAIGPEEQLTHMHVMILGATPPERVALLRKVKAAAPAPALAALLNAVRTRLGATEFADLTARLGASS